jgi:drug/metabolite transporter superfamily protein YnfA
MPEQSVFLKAYGNGPVLRVLDFLITFQEYDYSMKDIAKNAGVGYTTLKLFWKGLVERKMVSQTRIVGKAKMYRLNSSNPEVIELVKLYWLVIQRETGRVSHQKNRVAVAHR